jgi:molecular chaperone GrpE
MVEAENSDPGQPEQKPKPNGVDALAEGSSVASSKVEQVSTKIASTDIELEQLKSELNECKDKYLRILAESENARKRLQKERQELIQYAVQNVIVDFLNPIDHFENALGFSQQASDEVKHWALGFQMILSQFKDVLTSNGVSAVRSVGTSFDPNFHDAIEMVATADYPPGTVVEENLKGYKMGDRTIRPARVKVAKDPESLLDEETTIE